MNIFGIIFMTLSWGFILFIFIFSFYKTFKEKDKQEIEKRDLIA